MENTLKDYITFLRENKLAQEANFYNTEVVGILKKWGVVSPLDLSTKEVVSTLRGIKEAVTQTNTQPWDVELEGS